MNLRMKMMVIMGITLAVIMLFLNSVFIYTQGIFSLNVFMLLFIVGMVFIAVVLRILDKLILARLSSLDAIICEIKNRDDLSLRVNVIGDDEIAKLAISVNIALDALEKSQKELQTLRFTDALTGLYNRAFFEQETKRLEQLEDGFCGAVIICDIDGLKFVNDTLGHEAGDDYIQAVADIIKQAMTHNATAFRIGGDEFSIIIHHNTNVEVEEIYTLIQYAVMQYNAENPLVPLGLSMGYAMGPLSITEVIKEADAVMYREKLNNGPNNRSAIVESLIKVADIRDCLSEGHGERVLDLVMALSEAIDLPESGRYKLRVLAFFHDVGKVVIPETLISKKLELLTREEMILIQTHCEIGKRIAHATPDLIAVADYILKHHEHWDGSGYPLGLKGEDIPLECRILMIADSYDVMTSDRSYRNHSMVSHQEALEEIKSYSGTIYDPYLVDKFIEIMS